MPIKDPRMLVLGEEMLPVFLVGIGVILTTKAMYTAASITDGYQCKVTQLYYEVCQGSKMSWKTYPLDPK